MSIKSLFVAFAVACTAAFTTSARAEPDEPQGETESCYAMCNARHGMRYDWVGPVRSSRSAAEADAEKHNEDHPGHGAYVMC